MTIRTKVIDGNEYQFVNESWSTSRAWGHKSTLFLDEVEIGKNKVTYLNRTWESYQYKSCMQDVVSNLINKGVKDYIDNYKVEEGINKLKKGLREELTEKYKSEDGKQLVELLKWI